MVKKTKVGSEVATGIKVPTGASRKRRMPTIPELLVKKDSIERMIITARKNVTPEYTGEEKAAAIGSNLADKKDLQEKIKETKNNIKLQEVHLRALERSMETLEKERAKINGVPEGSSYCKRCKKWNKFSVLGASTGKQCLDCDYLGFGLSADS